MNNDGRSRSTLRQSGGSITAGTLNTGSVAGDVHGEVTVNAVDLAENQRRILEQLEELLSEVERLKSEGAPDEEVERPADWVKKVGKINTLTGAIIRTAKDGLELLLKLGG